MMMINTTILLIIRTKTMMITAITTMTLIIMMKVNDVNNDKCLYIFTYLNHYKLLSSIIIRGLNKQQSAYTE